MALDDTKIIYMYILILFTATPRYWPFLRVDCLQQTIWDCFRNVTEFTVTQNTCWDYFFNAVPKRKILFQIKRTHESPPLANEIFSSDHQGFILGHNVQCFIFRDSGRNIITTGCIKNSGILSSKLKRNILHDNNFVSVKPNVRLEICVLRI